MDEALYQKLSAIRDEYRQKMNSYTDAAQRAAAEDEMDVCAENSTAAERYREAFAALNRVFKVIEEVI
jgi:hypothetical protein